MSLMLRCWNLSKELEVEIIHLFLQKKRQWPVLVRPCEKRISKLSSFISTRGYKKYCNFVTIEVSMKKAKNKKVMAIYKNIALLFWARLGRTQLSIFLGIYRCQTLAGSLIGSIFLKGNHYLGFN